MNGTEGQCIIDGCDQEVYSRERCRPHYRRLLSETKASRVVHRRTSPDLAERYWSKVDKRGPDECWPWLGTLRPSGHGLFWINGKLRSAHQIAWEMANGDPFPADKVGDHTCHNVDPYCPGGSGCAHRACQNPAHIEPTASADNIRRGGGARRRYEFGDYTP